MKGITRLIRTVAMVLLGAFALSTSIQADIGIVTVDDEHIPPELLKGYAIRYESHLCSPQSDDRTREAVVRPGCWLAKSGAKTPH